MARILTSATTSSGFTAGSTITITKPTGLVVGDLLVAVLGAVKIGATNTFSTPSGWTLIRQPSGTITTAASFYKVADSSDVSASDFTFTNNQSSIIAQGVLYRIDDFDTSTVVDGSNEVAADAAATTTVVTGVTPSTTDDLLIMAGQQNGGNNDFSAYAIATSNPTWTETLAVNGFGVAYATRPESTATGSATLTHTSREYRRGIFILIKDRASVSVTLTAETMALTLTGISAIIGRLYTIAASVVAFTLSGIATGFSIVATLESRGLASVTALNKSTPTLTGQSRNNPTFTNQSRNPTTYSDVNPSGLASIWASTTLPWSLALPWQYSTPVKDTIYTNQTKN